MPSIPNWLRLDLSSSPQPARRVRGSWWAAVLVVPFSMIPAAEAQPAAPARTPTPVAGATQGMSAPSLGHLLATPTAPVDDPINALESLTPPDGKWLLSEDGREYFLTRLKKEEGTYTKLTDGKTVAYKKIYRWQYDREDAEYFYVRVYRAAENDAAFDPDAAKRVAEEQARIEASYQVDLPTVDRLEISAYDAGLPREGQWRQGFDIADMNGDGHPDILHGSPRKQIFTPVVFLGDGKGGWRYWSEVIWPRLPYDYGDAAAGDFDRDGRMDIALGIHLRGIKVLLQKAPGVFSDASEGLVFDVPGQGGDASSFASRALEVIDWNGDGKLDLIALGEGARQVSTAGRTVQGLPPSLAYGVVVFLNVDGSTWQASSVGAHHGVFGDSLAFGHLDGDERVDLVTASNTMGHRNVLFLNDSLPQGYRDVALDSIPHLAFTYAVAAGDFDEDGRDDVVTSFGTNEGGIPRSGLSLHSRDAEGAWKSRLLFVDSGLEAIWALASGDIDGDGHLDLAAASHKGKVSVLLGDGKGGVALEDSVGLDSPPACRGYGIRLADADGDGRPELFTSFAGEAGDMAKLLDQPVCVGEGSLRVWKLVPKPVNANS